MDTQTQVDRLIELAIIQRAELKQLVEQLPQLREHLNAEVEKVFEETEPQLRSELEEWTTKQTADKTAALGAALEAKIAQLAKSLEISTQGRYNAIIAEREENARLAAQAEQKIAAHAASLPGTVKEIVESELSRFPRAGEIDQLRKEFAEPKSLNPRGKWQAGEVYNKLDLVTINGDSFVSNLDDNRERPSRAAANWTLSAARGNSGGGGGITSLNDLLGNPSAGDIVGSSGTNYVRKTLTAGTGITITDDPNAITIDASGAQEILTATVKNADSVAITKGQVVYLFGATGGFPSVKLANNTSDETSNKTFGVVSDTSIAPNGTGTVTCVGVIDGLNLGAFSDGDAVYLGATAGTFTATKPYAPNHLVFVGIVERANAGNGELYVRIQNGYELEELHNVQILTPPLAGSLLMYDATNALWKGNRLTAGVGVSISNGDASVTISADGGVNYQGTWNANTNSPTLTSSVGTKGFYYVVSTAGTTNLNGVTDWQVGDWAIFNGTAWEKVDTTDQVSSVFGRTGAVVGVSTDYSAVGLTNTAIGASNPSTGAFTSLSSSSTTTLNGTTIPSSKTLVVTTDKLSALASTSSAELAGVISDETGSGALVFANTPTLVTPNIGAATGSSVNLSGNATVGGTLTVNGSSPSVFAGQIRSNLSNASLSDYQIFVRNAAASATNGAVSQAAFFGQPGYTTFVGTTGDGTSASYQGGVLGSAIRFSEGYVITDAANGLLLHAINGSIRLASGNPGSVKATFDSAGTLYLTATTASTTTSTGALVVSGGVGVAKRVTTGERILANASVSAAASTISTGATLYAGQIDNVGYGTKLLFDHSFGTPESQTRGAFVQSRVDVFGFSTDVGLGFGTTNGGSISEKMFLSSSGNLLIGTTTDSANGKLQLTTHTTSAGGIGFGTDISLFRRGNNTFGFTGSAGSGIQLTCGTDPYLQGIAGSGYIRFFDAGSTVIASAGTAALTINSSQQVQVNSSTASTSTSTGALVVSGGVGVAKAVYAGAEILSNDTNGAGFRHSAAAGLYRGLKLQTSGSDRWLFASNDATESGSNAGSDLVLFSYADAGTFLRENLKITRSTGAATFGGNITVTGTLTGNSTATIAGRVISNASSTVADAAGFAHTTGYSSGGKTYTGFSAGGIAVNQSAAFGYVYDSGTPANSFAHITPYGITEGSLFKFSPAGVLTLGATTASSSTSTGALVVGGGLGVGGAIFAGDSVTIPNAKNFVVRNAAGSSTGMRMYADSSDFGYIDCTANTELRLQVGAGTKLSITNTGNVSIPATTASTSTSSGALVVSGGVGVAKNASIGVSNSTGVLRICDNSFGSDYVVLTTAGTDATGTYGLFISQASGTGLNAPTGQMSSLRVNNAAIVSANSAGPILQLTGTAPTLTGNSSLTFEFTSNTSLTLKMRGSDGVTRSASITFS